MLIRKLAPILKKIIIYAEIIRQEVSKDKTRIYFPIHCQDISKRNIIRDLDFAPGNFPFKYLGTPISSRASSKQIFRECLDKFQNIIQS